MSVSFLMSLLFAGSLPPDSAAVHAAAPGSASDSLRDTLALHGPAKVVGLAKDSVGKPAQDTLPRRDWTLRLGGSMGAQFPSFSQRSRFRADMAAVATRDTLTVLQPFQSSEIAPVGGLELSLQWRQALRLVAEGQVLRWWNEASAARGDSVSRNWDVTVTVWRAGGGLDLLVPRQVLAIQGMGPLAIELRGWLLRSVLETSQQSQAWGTGWAVGLSSSFAQSSWGELGGRLRWHQETARGDGTWAALLMADKDASAPSWSVGGLEMSVYGTFDLGW